MDEGKRAYGVTYYRHGLTKFARATKEIILSAGAVMSPKILMNSGIGPTQHLEEIGVNLDYWSVKSHYSSKDYMLCIHSTI